METERPTPRQLPADPSCETVLIVDDSRAQRRLLSRALTKWGYAVLEAASGTEALSICESRQVSLVISDWLMPGMTGIDFCRAYRSLSGMHEGYFILLTAQTEREALAQGLESGADDFLSKPVSSIELRARLRAGERIVNARRALTSKNVELTDTLIKLTAAHSAIDRDLDEARKFQETLVPERSISCGSANVSLLFRPSGHVGGDMVGYFRVQDGELGLFALDVSGHGVSSALMTARVLSFFSNNAPDRNIALRAAGDGYFMEAPDVVCRRLNTHLQKDLCSDLYLTMVLAHVSCDTGTVRICQAGHPSPVIVRSNGQVDLHEAYGMPIGLLDNAEFQTTTIELRKGDKLLIYSDGITECPDPAGRLWDEKGLISSVHEHRASRGADFLSAIVRDVERHAGSAELPDDLSAVLIEKR